MQFERPFLRLPLSFDAERLAAEAAQFAESDWRAHPSGYEGNTALILISADGGQNDDTTGVMLPTPHLACCPYMQQVLASFGTVVGRSRLMRLAPGAQVGEHTDIAYYWRYRMRIHVPITTDPGVTFHIAGESQHLAAGEAWTIDNWRLHRVENPSSVTRIHLVADTVGTADFWRRLGSDEAPRFLAFDPEARPSFATESFGSDPVLHPDSLHRFVAETLPDLAAEPTNTPDALAAARDLLLGLTRDWRALWVSQGPAAEAPYRALIQEALAQLAGFGEELRVASNHMTLRSVVQAILSVALRPELAQPPKRETPARQRPVTVPGRTAAQRPPAARGGARVQFDRPTFIVAAPRSGSTLLFETLAANQAFWTVGDEAHGQFEQIPALNPKSSGFASNRVTAEAAMPEMVAALQRALARDARSRAGIGLRQALEGREGLLPIRFLEKTPKNALRIPFLAAAFPGARFVFLWRRARDNVSSLIESWRSGRYVTYRQLPDWPGPPWSHLLVPGWRDLAGRPIAEIAAEQWRITNETLLADLAALPRTSWHILSHESFLADPGGTLQRLCAFAEVPFGLRMAEKAKAPLKPSRYTLTAPEPEKWRRNAAELELVLPATEAVERALATATAEQEMQAGGLDLSQRVAG